MSINLFKIILLPSSSPANTITTQDLIDLGNVEDYLRVASKYLWDLLHVQGREGIKHDVIEIKKGTSSIQIRSSSLDCLFVQLMNGLLLLLLSLQTISQALNDYYSLQRMKNITQHFSLRTPVTHQHIYLTADPEDDPINLDNNSLFLILKQATKVFSNDDEDTTYDASLEQQHQELSPEDAKKKKKKMSEEEEEREDSLTHKCLPIIQQNNDHNYKRKCGREREWSHASWQTSKLRRICESMSEWVRRGEELDYAITNASGGYQGPPPSLASPHQFLSRAKTRNDSIGEIFLRLWTKCYEFCKIQSLMTSPLNN